MVRGKWVRFFGVFSVASVLVAGFQNCTPRVYLSSSNDQASESANGNGGTYDGKPDPGEYLRQYPNGCPNSSSKNIIGIMSVSTLKGTIKEDLCFTQNYGFEFDDERLVFSDYNPDFIGFNGAIFESTRSYQESPAPVEAWCRNTSSNEGLDLVVKNNGLGLMYRGSSPSRQVFTVQRSATTQSLTFASTQNNLNLIVDLSAAQNLTYAAQASLQLDGQNLNLNLSCRIMGLEPAVYSSPANVLAVFQMDGNVASSNGRVGSVLRNPDGAGANFVSGHYGSALNMDGEDDYVDVSGIAPFVTNSGEFSISMWMRADLNISDDTAAFTVNSNDGSHNLFKFGTGHCSGSGDRLNLTLEVGSGCYDSGQIVVDGAWHLVTLVVTVDRVVLYSDGIERANQPHGESMAGDDLWSIGQDFDGSSTSDFWFGQLDEVIVWDRALSPTEIP